MNSPLRLDLHPVALNVGPFATMWLLGNFGVWIKDGEDKMYIGVVGPWVLRVQSQHRNI